VKNQLIISLDVPDLRTAQRLVDELSPLVEIFKVGSQLFTAEGAKVVSLIHKKRKRVFLDLKFYDIPHTVGEAVRAATRLGVFMFNVHSIGGLEMMKTAAEVGRKEAERLGIKKPFVLAVTLLTNFTQQALEEIGIKKDLNDYVLFLAQQSKQVGLDGIIASPRELRFLRDKLGKHFIMVTPGIRLSVNSLQSTVYSQYDDQKRVATPREAIKRGADYIVVGRPIISAPFPAKAAKQIIKEMEG